MPFIFAPCVKVTSLRNSPQTQMYSCQKQRRKWWNNWFAVRRAQEMAKIVIDMEEDLGKRSCCLYIVGRCSLLGVQLLNVLPFRDIHIYAVLRFVIAHIAHPYWPIKDKNRIKAETSWNTQLSELHSYHFDFYVDQPWNRKKEWFSNLLVIDFIPAAGSNWRQCLLVKQSCSPSILFNDDISLLLQCHWKSPNNNNNNVLKWGRLMCKLSAMIELWRGLLVMK